MDRIGIRELRQYASRYLARVAGGEMIEITDRGRPIARLIPLSGDLWLNLVAEGRILSADDDLDIADEAPRDFGIDASATLAAMRSGER